jgi:hypothetical protein
MNLVEYVPLAVRTEKPLPVLGRMGHSCMGLVTEIGEIATELKRMHIYGKPLDTERKAHILEEIGDVMWYVAIMLDVAGVDLELVRNAPQLNQPLSYQGMHEATALMLGDHCGRVCAVVQETLAEESITEDGANKVMASLTMIMNGCRVLAEQCESTLEQAMEDNIAKLRLRFPDAYSNEAAEGRADKGGLDARNS